MKEFIYIQKLMKRQETIEKERSNERGREKNVTEGPVYFILLRLIAINQCVNQFSIWETRSHIDLHSSMRPVDMACMPDTGGRWGTLGRQLV